MLATPGMGHLIPLAELAKLLAARHGATVTLLTFASMASATQLLHAALAGTLAELKRTTRLVAFVTDHFCVNAFDSARDAGVGRRCLFIPGSLHALTLMLHLPELVASVPGEFRDLPEPLRLPGCVPIPGLDAVFSALQDRSSPAYGMMVHLAERFRQADTFLVNSFDAIEPEVASVLRQPKPGRPLVYSIGPLILTAEDRSTGDSDAKPPPPRAACLEWLDRQPARSVIFVSFGSGGALPVEQMRELALGLELSGQRFLWVVRSPTDEGSAEVLAHEATGGFLTHCGWNSTLESLVHGMPMVAWPLYAEQRLNAVMLSEGVGAAIRLPEMKEKETIAEAVREVMAGEGKGAAVRAKVAEVQKAAAESLREGGAAMAALDGVVENWAPGGNY
ncbi:unnamed protein product [Urochloa decumbens]|uniref:Glycosyltransferase n=1 Tax=Urochloa decumbens TaxID=240449 RepID=A0ABC9BMZ0_9POAL